MTSTRVLPGGIDDWFRIDFGYTLGYGDIDFSNVQEIRFQVRGPDDGPIRLWIDDLRAGPARDESNVILAFYGGLESHYNTVFPILQERGWPAVAAVSRDLLNRSGRLLMDQLREMRDAGWEVCSYPQHAGDLTELSAREQRRVIESNRDYLANREFERGSRHFFTPYNAMNTDTLEILRETHETGFVCVRAAFHRPDRTPSRRSTGVTTRAAVRPSCARTSTIKWSSPTSSRSVGTA